MTARHYYIQAILHVRWLLDAVETYLISVPDSTMITPVSLQMVTGHRMASLDEVAVIIEALLDIGILLPGPPLRVSRQALEETKGYRRGVRDTLEALPASEPPVQLCATLPYGLPSLIEDTLREELHDLSTALFDLIVSAQSRVIIASPFWDKGAGQELTGLFEKRLASGIVIDVLGRVDGGKDNTFLDLSKRFIGRPGIRFYNWYKPDINWLLTQTFHFKAAATDNGAKAYLGSANMTYGGLRSRMELGVILQGHAARTLASILDMILQLSISMEEI